MSKAAVTRPIIAFILGFVVCAAQPLPQLAGSSTGTELPIVMRQSILAGKTPVGTKVQAKLVAATLVDGVVVPRDAILSGEVTESAKRSASEPSRLAVCMDSVNWKKGSLSIKVYLTAWYYPAEAAASQDLAYQPRDAANSKGKWNGMGTYPDPNNPISQQKFPAGDRNEDAGSTPASPASSISKHPVFMKNVESFREPDGAVLLMNQHADLRLDKVTTYVVASSDRVPAN